ncbi:hypothetical protein [Thauera sp.]|uniref:hypothetical protein n=1 Tax=Thauera sp. TaxID=1905334 RepID=UPI0039E6F230
MNRLTAFILAMATALAAGPAAADIEAVTFSGFATLGAVVSQEKDLQFLRMGIDNPGTDRLNFGSDSVLGAQGNFRFSGSTEAVVQVLTRRTPTNDYNPRASLAFISFAPTPELTLRAGRLRVPAFMLSDSFDINYAHPWGRPPNEVYSLNPFADLDGIDLLYRTRIGSLDLELHPYFGRSRVDIMEFGRASLSRLRGLNIGLSSGSLTLHFGYSRASLDLHWGDREFDLLQNVLNTLPQGKRILAEMHGKGASESFTSAGFHWDDNRWLLIGEYAVRRSSAFVNSAHGWHLTAGRHLGPVTPYVKVARSRQDSRIVDRQLSEALLPPPVASFVEAFNVSRNTSQRSIAAGLRWDLHTNAAMKIELARNYIDRNGWGSFQPTRDILLTRVSGRTVNTLSLSIDVVF